MVLQLLIASGEMYGLEMVSAVPELKRGTIYVTLGRMADKGLVESRELKLEHERGLPRRMFKATGVGERAFKAYQAAFAVLDGAMA